MTDERSPTFCVIPWIHLASRPDGKLNLCCTASGELLRDDERNEMRLDRHSVAEIWNCKSLRGAREAFASGRPIKGCEACYLNERNGKLSTRQMFNENWTNRIGLKEIQRRITESRDNDWKLESQPIYLDLRLSNKCNLKCRMCFPVYSHGLAKEFAQIQASGARFPMGYQSAEQIPVAWSESKIFMENMERLLPYSNELYFAGGEPFLMQGTEEILKMAIDRGFAKRITLSFHTNCTVWNSEIGRLLPEFSAVHLNCSVKGVGRVDEYIRNPVKFAVVDKTLRHFFGLAKEHAHIYVRLACAISWQSVFDLPELAEWYCSLIRENSGVKGEITFNLVNYPTFLSVKMIPAHLREDVLRSIERTMGIFRDHGMETRRNIEGLKAVEFIVRRGEAVKSRDVEDLIHHTQTLDSIRNESLAASIPKAARVFQHYSGLNSLESEL